MARRSRLHVLFLLATAAAGQAQVAHFTVHDQTLATIDKRLFGQFMERPSWGETGIEAAVVPETHKLQPKVLKLLKGLDIPILRFPGGTDVDFIDWTDMIDLSGRAARPVTTGHLGHKVTNRFGYDEFLKLCEDLKTEPLIAVNFRDALLGVRSIDEAAQRAADLVAYCEGTSGKWAEQRAKNGRKKPYRVRYWQIGNETWGFLGDLQKRHPLDANAYYVRCLKAYVTAMRKVDPKIEILADGNSEEQSLLIRQELGGQVNYLVDHMYSPWGHSAFRLGDQPVPIERLTAQDVWNAWVAVAPFDPGTGNAVMRMPLIGWAPRHGYPVAVTEWNFNGWWQGVQNPPLDSNLARGLGAAGMLHALMRSGNTVKIACQSMTVGNRWGITAIHLPNDDPADPYYLPSGQVVGLYSQHHGNRLLRVDPRDVPAYAQPYWFNAGQPNPKVAYLDTLVTADGRAVYIHIINREFTKALPIEVDLSALKRLQRRATQLVLTGRLNNAPAPGEPRQVATIRSQPLAFDGRILRVSVPARSVCIYEVARG